MAPKHRSRPESLIKRTVRRRRLHAPFTVSIRFVLLWIAPLDTIQQPPNQASLLRRGKLQACITNAKSVPMPAHESNIQTDHKVDMLPGRRSDVRGALCIPRTDRDGDQDVRPGGPLRRHASAARAGAR